MMSKEYFKEQYAIAVSDWKIAANDNDRDAALREMRRLMEVSFLLYGKDFTDELEKMHPFYYLVND